MKVFVAAPYTENMDNDFLSQIESFLKEINIDPIIPHNYIGKHATLNDEIQNNFSILDEADAIIAEVSKPSHGVGMEILYAYQKGKKVIFIKKSGTKLSDMALVHGDELIEYETMDDLKKSLEEVFK